MWQYLVFAGAFIQLAGVSFYVKDTIRGKSKPNRMTWLLWAAAPLIAAAAAFADGVGWAALPVFMSGFGPFLVLLASFINPNSYWRLHTFDYICGVCSALALILWALTAEPIVAIIFAILSDGLAVVPTLIKSWKYPETETGIAYVMSLLAVLTSFAAVKTWSFSAIAFPIYLVVAILVLIFAIYRKRIFRSIIRMKQAI